MNGYMVCANDDYLRFIYGEKFRSFELLHLMVGMSNFPLPLDLFGVN